MSLNEYCYLLNEAQELVNEELKEKFEKGEITSPLEIFYETSWLDVIQIFNYELDYWQDHVINYELSQLLGLIRIHNLTNETARQALKLIAAYIYHTETCHIWHRYGYKAQFIGSFGKYFPAHKPINYDYLRYVLNQDILTNENETEAVITS